MKRIAMPAFASLREHIHLDTLARALIVLFAAALPFLYDLAVPEVSGDIRWNANILVSFLLVLLGVGIHLRHKKEGLTVRTEGPLIFWLAGLLAVWCLVSLIDSISIYRAIWPLKFLYAQLVLMVAVACFWKSGWTKALLWALAVPVAFTSWLGILQFFGWNDASFAYTLRQTDAFAWLGNLWPKIFPNGGPWDKLLGFYLSSAIPGSSFANKNLAGSYTAMMIPMVLMLLVVARRVWQKLLASLVLALAVLFLVYSRARASWVALFVSIILLAVFVIFVPEWRRAVLHQFKLGFWVAMVPVLIVVGMYGGKVSPIQAHGITISPAEQVENLYKASYNEIGGRIAYNLNSLAIIKDHWFNGVGLGAFYAAYPMYHDTYADTPTNSYSVTARPQRTHSDLMQAFDELGLVGGLAYIGILLTGLWMAWRLRGIAEREELPLTERFFPLFAGISLLTASGNALMDFPMQLPTVPAIAMMLLGVLTWQYVRAYPNDKISKFVPFKPWRGKQWALGTGGVLLLGLVALQVGGVALWDSYKFREANMVLKQAMIRGMAGVVDDETKRLIDEAQKIYGLDPRVHEHLGVFYSSYNGSKNLTTQDRIDMLEWVLKGDPYGPNHLVNLSGQYLTLAETAQLNGDPAAAQKALERVDEFVRRLKVSAGFSYYTYGIAGMQALLRGQTDTARSNFEQALKLDPSYAPALNGMQILKQRGLIR